MTSNGVAADFSSPNPYFNDLDNCESVRNNPSTKQTGITASTTADGETTTLARNVLVFLQHLNICRFNTLNRCYCRAEEWACIPVGKSHYSRLWAKEHTNESSGAGLTQAKHLLSILMGINGRARTGDRRVDWLAGYCLSSCLQPTQAAVTCRSAVHQLMCISRQYQQDASV